MDALDASFEVLFSLYASRGASGVSRPSARLLPSYPSATASPRRLLLVEPEPVVRGVRRRVRVCRHSPAPERLRERLRPRRPIEFERVPETRRPPPTSPHNPETVRTPHRLFTATGVYPARGPGFGTLPKSPSRVRGGGEFRLERAAVVLGRDGRFDASRHAGGCGGARPPTRRRIGRGRVRREDRRRRGACGALAPTPTSDSPARGVGHAAVGGGARRWGPGTSGAQSEWRNSRGSYCMSPLVVVHAGLRGNSSRRRESRVERGRMAGGSRTRETRWYPRDRPPRPPHLFDFPRGEGVATPSARTARGPALAVTRQVRGRIRLQARVSGGETPSRTTHARGTRRGTSASAAILTTDSTPVVSFGTRPFDKMGPVISSRAARG